MEKYNDIENTTFDAFDTSGARDATLVTTNDQKQEAEYQVKQRRQLDVERERKQVGKLGILEVTSGNKMIQFNFKTGEPYYHLQIARHIEIEETTDNNQVIDIGIFKPTSGNTTKRLRMRQKMRGVSRNNEIAEATLK